MKHHLPELHKGGFHVDLKHLEHKLEEGEHWLIDHPWLISLVLTCLIASLILALLSAIHVYFSTGVWTLWG